MNAQEARDRIVSRLDKGWGPCTLTVNMDPVDDLATALHDVGEIEWNAARRAAEHAIKVHGWRPPMDEAAMAQKAAEILRDQFVTERLRGQTEGMTLTQDVLDAMDRVEAVCVIWESWGGTSYGSALRHAINGPGTT